MSQAALKKNGKLSVYRNFHHLTIDKVSSEYEQIKRKDFDYDNKRAHSDYM